SAIHLGPKAEARVAEWVDVGQVGALGVRFEVRSDRGSATAESRLVVEPRGRAGRAESTFAVTGSRQIAVAIPEPSEGAGALTLSVAAHPFVGFDSSLEALLASEDAGTEPTASSVIGLAAYAGIDTGKRPGSATAAELGTRAAQAIKKLSKLQTVAGGF